MTVLPKSRYKPSSMVSVPSQGVKNMVQPHFHSNNAFNLDPTHTITLRKAYAGAMRKRFRSIRRLIWEAIVEDDAFGLSHPRVLAVSRARFAFATDAGKVDGFMDWLQGEVDNNILEVTHREGRRITAHKAWQNVYIDSAYKKGMKRSNAELKKRGYVPFEGVVPPDRAIDSAFNLPIHADKVGLLYTRNFNELKGITDAMDQQISRTLAGALAEGKGPRQMARELMNRVSRVGDMAMTDRLGRFVSAEQRAIILARTETIRAHHVATINTYREAGVEGVMVKAEWVTAGDGRVCDDCLDLEGEVFTLDVIEPMIPLHPLCRCVAVPADIKFSKEARRKAEIEQREVGREGVLSKSELVKREQDAINDVYRHGQKTGNEKLIAISEKGQTISATGDIESVGWRGSAKREVESWKNVTTIHNHPLEKTFSQIPRTMKFGMRESNTFLARKTEILVDDFLDAFKAGKFTKDEILQKAFAKTSLEKGYKYRSYQFSKVVVKKP